MDYPVIVFALSLVMLWLSAQTGAYFHRRRRQPEAEHEDLGVLLAATLTLLGLIIGFSFSMAVTRYDQRKNYEAGRRPMQSVRNTFAQACCLRPTPQRCVSC